MTIQTIYYDEVPREPRALDVVLPDEVSAGPAICLVHGGGWYAGAREAYHEVMNWFAQRGYACASLGYRTDGESRIAEKISDVACGYLRFVELLKERKEGVPVLMGSSAGAHLITLLAESGPAPWAPEMTEEWPAPAGCIPVNGPGTALEWEGIHPEIKASLEKLCDSTYEEHPEVFRNISPEHHISDFTPPFLVLLAENERVFPHSFVYKWVQELRQAGVHAEVHVIPGTEHGFLYSTQEEPQRAALALIERFLQFVSLRAAGENRRQVSQT
uniref:alpha/beta hydrolase n=1 Tax=Paenarthrobacter ureafaciens TaxID=37931 RepID=UPI003F497833